MSKKLLTTIILSIIYIFGYAQVPDWAWAKGLGGAGNDLNSGVATDSYGNVYITGQYYSTSITFGTTTLTNADSTGNTADIYIVKYDASGNLLWAMGEGSAITDRVYSITTDDSNNVYVTGSYSASFTFGTFALSNAGSRDMFIVKFNSAGNIIWAKGEGSAGDDICESITTDDSGNIYLTGYYNSNSISFGVTTLGNSGGYDIFIVKYDTTGNVIWAKGIGGTGWDEGLSIVADAASNVYITGIYYSTSITFGTITLTNADITGNFTDIFIVKYDASGNLLWAKGAGGAEFDESNSIITDVFGNLYITGYYYSPFITFGSTTLNNANAANLGDIFIVKFDTLGNVLWANDLGGLGDDRTNTSAADSNGNVYIAGFYNSPSLTFGSTASNNLGGYDIFILKYDNSGNELWAKSIGDTGNDIVRGITTNASGNVYISGLYNSNSITFGSFTLLNSNQGYNDAFIAKLNCGPISILTSAASYTPTVCINVAITNITHTTIGATGIGAATGLPAGVTAAWASNTITISGTPTTSGTFNYSIPLTGNCETVSATGTITVNPNNTVSAASYTPTVCINVAITNITHTTIGATGIGAATGLPAGVTAAWASNTITISGTPTASGTFNYSIPLTGNCGTASATGTITVNPNNTVSAASSTPTVCINTAITNITHTTIGATGIGAATGLPAGVTAFWTSNTITISGTPTASGTFNYSIPLTGGCGTTVNATGTITVTTSNTGTALIIACDNYTWIDGVTYTSSNSAATYVLTNQSGCDSTVTLNLTINNSNTGTELITACDAYTWIDGNTYTSNNNSATYTIVGGSVNGCDSIVTLNLTINTTNTLVTEGLGVLTANNATGAAYQWLDCDNGFAVIAGETNQSFTPTASGNYAVLISENGCSDTSACFNVFVVGLNANNNTSNILIYPNPTNELLTIQASQPLLIEIYSLEGNLIESKKIIDTSNFGIGNYVNGMYLIKATDNNGGYSYHKLVKQ
jgi:hypothetical protein